MKKTITFLLTLLLTQSVLFAQDYVLQFDGANSRVKYANETTMENMNGATDYTIEAWFYPTDADIHNNVIVKRWFQFAITMYQDTNKRVYFTHYADNGATSTYINSLYNVVNLNAWNHVAVINNSTANTLKIYVNGVDVSADVDGNPTTYTSMPLDANPGADANFYIGYGGSGTVPFAYIDKVRVKNIAEDIANLETSDVTAAMTADANTQLMFNLDEGTGDTTVNDVNSVDATLECTGGCAEIPQWVLLADTMSVNEGQDISFDVYPNPVVNNVFTVQARSNEQIERVQIINIDGRIVKNIDAAANKLNIATEGLSSGNYFVRIQTNMGAGTQNLIVK